MHTEGSQEETRQLVPAPRGQALGIPVGNEQGIERFESQPIEIDDPLVKFELLEKPQRVFFYQRRDADGDILEDSPIFACNEQEAAMTGRFSKQIGSSDGRAYYETLLRCGVKKGHLIPLSRAKSILQAAFDAELEVARGHKVRPQLKTHTLNGVLMTEHEYLSRMGEAKPYRA